MNLCHIDNSLAMKWLSLAAEIDYLRIRCEMCGLQNCCQDRGRIEMSHNPWMKNAGGPPLGLSADLDRACVAPDK